MCGYAPVVTQGIRRLRPGGAAVLVGCVTPDTALSLTGKEVNKELSTGFSTKLKRKTFVHRSKILSMHNLIK